MRYDNRHSKFVALVRIVLPLAALALLSTLFLFSDKVDPTQARLYSEVDVDALANEPRVNKPEYSGMTRDGSELTVRAEVARPDLGGGNGTTADHLIAKLEAPSGTVTDLSALSGRIDPVSDRMELRDKVAMQTSQGYRMNSDYVEMATDQSWLTSPGPVQGEAPFGTLEAGSMEMVRDDKGDHDLVFNGGVKLIYQPQE